MLFVWQIGVKCKNYRCRSSVSSSTAWHESSHHEILSGCLCLHPIIIAKDSIHCIRLQDSGIDSEERAANRIKARRSCSCWKAHLIFSEPKQRNPWKQNPRAELSRNENENENQGSTIQKLIHCEISQRWRKEQQPESYCIHHQHHELFFVCVSHMPLTESQWSNHVHGQFQLCLFGQWRGISFGGCAGSQFSCGRPLFESKPILLSLIRLETSLSLIGKSSHIRVLVSISQRWTWFSGNWDTRSGVSGSKEKQRKQEPFSQGSQASAVWHFRSRLSRTSHVDRSTGQRLTNARARAQQNRCTRIVTHH